ncbi:conserved hypothetical protein [Treponema primitia ZAS-2]|uniref:Uncharacterized protein n=1 Tax=Treponema primitia (strain ATCC BAA-887 / DSM 12427 / ZAS-2) TaxID=545694 RepID=F5YLH6_TREPZ|nr:hypothetical protein [Treponema primitia]AEF83740.1 conserved hypothetical protein [Treponema primitia ZAS-2]
MNQDQIKATLLSIEDAPMDFTVILSGKKSVKVNGLYKPDTREIIIHNKNFDDDNLLLYTAIHEYAHHLHACSQGGTLPSRAHSTEFWAILHALLEKAEARGVYKNVFTESPELAELTETIRQKCLLQNGSLVKELGMLLLKAGELCNAIGARFEDYIDRVLCIPRAAAKMSMKMFEYDLDPAVGADNMRFLAGIKNEDDRMTAEKSLLAGKSPDAVKLEAKKKPDDEDPRHKLEKEKIRLERTIASLTKRLDEVERELDAGE